MGDLYGNHMETFTCCFGGSGINVRKYDIAYLLAGWCWSGGFIFLWVHSEVCGFFFPVLECIGDQTFRR